MRGNDGREAERRHHAVELNGRKCANSRCFIQSHSLVNWVEEGKWVDGKRTDLLALNNDWEVVRMRKCVRLWRGGREG